LVHEEEKKEEEVVVVGVKYLVSLADLGMQVFLFFRMTRRWGCKFFRTRRRSEWNVLRMWGLRRRRSLWGTM
jgi:hypothetical protein